MDLMHVKITFEDTLSGCKTTRIVTRSLPTIDKMKADIGKVVHTTFENHIRFIWKLISIEQN